MTAYFILHRRKIIDPEGLKGYSAGIDDSINRFGGRVAVRKDAFEVLEGEWEAGRAGDDARPGRVVVIEFPDMKALKSWYNSPAYAGLRTIRQRNSMSDAVAVDVR